ncbi:MAG TPA: hypothetical protein VJ803_08275 [Gemmatimonadaceae bacterium]|nr:hypothetical protein [Gemmatimonadaceae bacterium]
MHSPGRNALLATVLVAFPLAAQQRAAATQLPPLLAEAEEIALARSAAPAWISDSATVYVLRRGGHVKARTGSNGFSCLVARDNPESLYPICYDREASRTILPVELRQQRLREQGRTEEEIDREIGYELARGTFRPPTGAAVSYMMSRDQVLFAGPTGRRVGQWHPHVMIYVPYASAAQLGLDPGQGGHVFVGDEGKPTAHLVIIVPEWSKGGPAR